MCGEYTPPSVVYGVVYGEGNRRSGGGGRTWVCRGVVDVDTLTVDRCAPVADWFDGADASDSGGSPGIDGPEAPHRPTLTTFLADLPETVAAGLDFPFGLPECVVAEDTWTAFLRDLPTWCSSPEDLRWRCERRLRLADGAAESRLRATDTPLSALSPFDDRIVASTFFGLRDVLRPLVLSDRVRVPPMTAPRADRPIVFEVYPAGTLVDLDLFTGDDGGEPAGRAGREETVTALSAAADVDIDVTADAHDQVVGADAGLESLVAAYAVYRNTRSASALSVSDPQRLVEGQVFV